MEKVLISQMDKLEDFDIVELVDDETQEFRGYYLHSSYKKEIENLWESERVQLELGEDIKCLY